MIIDTRINGIICELKLEVGNVKITEDLTEVENGNWIVPELQIQQFFTVAFDLSRFNKKPDVETMKMLFDSFLSDGEKEQFIELISEG